MAAGDWPSFFLFPRATGKRKSRGYVVLRATLRRVFEISHDFSLPLFSTVFCLLFFLCFCGFFNLRCENIIDAPSYILRLASLFLRCLPFIISRSVFTLLYFCIYDITVCFDLVLVFNSTFYFTFVHLFLTSTLIFLFNLCNLLFPFQVHFFNTRFPRFARFCLPESTDSSRNKFEYRITATINELRAAGRCKGAFARTRIYNSINNRSAETA